MRNIFHTLKKALILLSFGMFLFIALGFSLQSDGSGAKHLCPLSPGANTSCMANDISHAQHWLSFLSISPTILAVFFGLAILCVAFATKHILLAFFHNITLSPRKQIRCFFEISYLNNLFSDGVIGSRAP